MDLTAQVSEHSWLGGFVVMQAIMDDITFEPEHRRLLLLKKAYAEAVDEELAFSED
jgi:hypothetical protein